MDGGNWLYKEIHSLLILSDKVRTTRCPCLCLSDKVGMCSPWEPLTILSDKVGMAELPWAAASLCTDYTFHIRQNIFKKMFVFKLLQESESIKLLYMKSSKCLLYLALYWLQGHCRNGLVRLVYKYSRGREWILIQISLIDDLVKRILFYGCCDYVTIPWRWKLTCKLFFWMCNMKFHQSKNHTNKF